MKPLSFFTDHIGSFIKRGNTDVYVKDLETARALYEVQDERYTFSAPLRIHKRELEECESCSA